MPEEYLKLTPIEFFHALNQRHKKEEDLILNIVRPICESVRMSTLYLFNIQVRKKDRIRNVKKLMVFPWERKYTKPQTLKEMKGVMKVMTTKIEGKKGKKRRVRKRGPIGKTLDRFDLNKKKKK